MIIRDFVHTLKRNLEERDPLIQMIAGPRQVGKTTGVQQYLEKTPYSHHFVMAGGSETSVWIIEQWQKASLLGENALLIIDEIQKVYGWSEVLKKLWDEQSKKKNKVKVVLLGSSSLSLFKGASESLAGRFEMIRVFHWDYLESKNYIGMSLSNYLKFGGYPKSYDYLNDYDRWYDYVKESIINNVIDRDILNTEVVKKPALFRQSFEVLSCYPSQEMSYRKILGELQQGGNIETLKYYLKLFEGAFLMKTLLKYGTQDFKMKTSSPKILPMAPCFYHLYSSKDEKFSFVFESMVGVKLLSVSSDLCYWRDGNDEVDFILTWRKKVFAIEVKSGRKKRSNGLTSFQKKFPDSSIVIIDKENFEKFLKDPKDFLLACS